MAVISAETKIQAVEQYYAGAGSLNQIAERFGVHRSTLQKWLLNHDLFGEEGLRHRAGNHHYPAIVKQQAVELYLSGQMSIEAVCKKYQLRSRSQLEQWVMLYNGQKDSVLLEAEGVFDWPWYLTKNAKRRWSTVLLMKETIS